MSTSACLLFLPPLQPFEAEEDDNIKVTKEQQRTGSVTMSVYKDYFMAGGSPIFVFSVMLLMISAQVSRVEFNSLYNYSGFGNLLYSMKICFRFSAI